MFQKLIFMAIILIRILENHHEGILNTNYKLVFFRKIDLQDLNCTSEVILVPIKMFASKNYSHGPIFMCMAKTIMKLAFVLIFLGKTSFFEGED